MGRIAVITDSSSDIPARIADKYDITILPMYISFGGRTYKEGEGISSQKVYNALETGQKIYTSGPSVGDYTRVYAEKLKQDDIDKIYNICLSSRLSGTINSALAAQKNFPGQKIKIVDSKNATISLGLIVMEVARLAQMGMPEPKLMEKMDLLIEKTTFFAAIENFKHVLRSGRTPFLSNLLSKALIFKPVVSINASGKIYLKRILRNKNNAINELYKQAVRHIGQGFSWNIGIFYGPHKEPAMYLKRKFVDRKDLPVNDIIMTEITTVISAHTGPGIWGVALGPRIDG